MITIRGERFKSINAACNYYRVDHSYLSKKSKRTGKSKEQLLIEKIDEGARTTAFTYNDKTYNNLTHLCKDYGLDPVKVQSLMGNRGLSKEDAIAISIQHNGDVPRNRRGHVVEVKGESFNSRASACRKYAVSPSAIRHLESKGYTFEEAILLKIQEDSE